ncbi:MAG: DUF4328 domain-containing protein [Actinobacteria bacterium]|nr:DUF4328 domain-containing protein [Actinomycetota bacterium]
MTATSGGAPPAAGEPGWFPDPWGTEKLRWWDGQAWTPHLYPPADPGPSAAPGQSRGEAAAGQGVTAGGGWSEAASRSTTAGGLTAESAGSGERVAAHWGRIGLLWAGPLQGLYDVGVAIQAGWYADHFDQLAKGHSPKLTGAAASVAPLLTYCSLGVLVAGVLFLVWMYRAAAVARALGLPARRSPGLATVSFLIPVVNLWWPYQSTCDLLPPGHPGRHVVGRWWATWLTSSLLVPAIFVSGYGPVWLRSALAAVAAGAALAAAAAARVVIATVVDAHNALLAGGVR